MKVPALLGPTASGKTALALELARAFPLEVVSADAMLVYRGMDIGTAKPSLAERQRVPHHLIDLQDPDQDYDVARFVQDAEQAIADVLARGNLPLVVGGTGFYVKALVQGLPLTPRADGQVQQQVWQDLHTRGLDALLQDIAQHNPEEAQRMQRNPRRVVRALEVFQRTGKFPGEFGHSVPRHEYQLFGLSPDLPELEHRISLRVQQMFEQGLLTEAEALRDRFTTAGQRRPTSLQAIGYKEVLGGLEQGQTVQQMTEHITLATRQYARRQLTWMKTQLGVEARSLTQVREALQKHLSEASAARS